MDEIAQFHLLIRERASQVSTRIGFAAMTAGLIMWQIPSVWALVWLGAVIAAQGAEWFFDVRVLPRWTAVTPRLRLVLAIVCFFQSWLYGSITFYIWFYAPYGPLFAAVMMCASLLHNCLILNPMRLIMWTALTTQSLTLLSLPIASMFSVDRPTWPVFFAMMAAFFGYLLHFVMVAERNRRAYEALVAARALAEQANLSKSRFLATISHEIRTPLNAVTAAAHLLSRTDLPPAANEHVSILLTGSEVLLRLVDNVLDMSKIEAGRMEIYPSNFELQQAVEQAVAISRPRAGESGVELKIALAADLPQAIECDVLRLTQILINLLSNALKFTAEGSVTMTVARSADRLWFDVTDTGPGISEESLGRLFKSFEQGDAAIAHEFGGTGLGLAISHKLADLLGGELLLVTTSPAGTTFRLDLPLVPASLPDASDAPAEAGGLASDGEHLAILVAEDHPLNRRLLELVLEPLEAELISVENGAEAVREAGLRRFDVILMDMQMPVMSGLEAARRITGAAGPNQNTPIIAVTANALDEQRVQWEAAGFTGYLTKPIGASVLIRTITQLTSERRPSAERATASG
jgi:signal transduction histidine kinase/CheY-like chemotaxis protein